MRKLALLAPVLTLLGLGAAAMLRSFVTAAPATEAEGARISIAEIHRQVDARSLPQLEIVDPF
jgi:hypothetical protein